MQRNGSETLLPTDASRPVTLTNAASLTCDRTTSLDTRSAISSPGLQAGHSLSGRSDGPTIIPSGLEAAPASHSVLLERAKPSGTRDTSGRCGLGSLASAALQSALES